MNQEHDHYLFTFAIPSKTIKLRLKIITHAMHTNSIATEQFQPLQEEDVSIRKVESMIYNEKF